jgi:hypothetical protein
MFTADTTKTAGQNVTRALRYYLSVGPRSRRFRTDANGYRKDLHLQMIEELILNAQNPGINTEAISAALCPGYGAALSYEKHIGGYRADCTLIRQVGEMTPWQFAALLGKMVDAGVTNTGQGERFFAEMARGLRAGSAA